MRFIGDIHGKIVPYARIIREVEQSVQIGDFGFGFLDEFEETYVRSVWGEKNHRFIRGNHDDPEKSRNFPGFIHDGTVETIGSTKVMFIGGAWSIDQHYRTEGVSWWRDEECSMEEFSRFLDIFVDAKPRIVVTHDCPNRVANEMFFDGYREKAKPSRTSQALDRMFEEHRPDVWIFGHWHMDRRATIEGTEFVCLGELSYLDLDL